MPYFLNYANTWKAKYCFLDFFQCFMELNCIMKWFSSFSKEETKILSKHLERAQPALIFLHFFLQPAHFFISSSELFLFILAWIQFLSTRLVFFLDASDLHFSDTSNFPYLNVKLNWKIQLRKKGKIWSKRDTPKSVHGSNSERFLTHKIYAGHDLTLVSYLLIWVHCQTLFIIYFK